MRLLDFVIHVCKISIHAPRTGSDTRWSGFMRCHQHFNPRSPHGERLSRRKRSTRTATFQSTLPARGATFSEEEKHEDSDISIHAPRTGSDPNPSQTHWRPCISIHAPRTGSDARAKAVAITSAIFQSTLPARGATEYSSHRSMLRLFQSTLPARGATMSCHLPVFGSRFQSTLPARGATSVMEAMLPPSMHFNPRSPHGERRR